MIRIIILSIFILVGLINFSFSNEKTLRWGADSEGGIPFVFIHPQDPEKIMGFEVDLMELLAKKLQMQSEHIQNSWDGLIPALNRGTYDLAINGLEITEERKEKVLFTEPYFITSQMIAVRAENTDILKLNDLVGKSVGTLKFSLAHQMLESKGGMDIRTYESEANAYQDLENGRIDSVFLDAPIAIYQGKPNPKIKVLPDQIGRMTYGIALRKSDTVLTEKINTVLNEIKKNGELRTLYERWNLWNAQMEEAFGPGPEHLLKTNQADRYENYLEMKGYKRTWQDYVKQYLGYFPMLIKGAGVTLALSLVSMFLAVSLGMLLTLLRIYAYAPIGACAQVYIEIIRGTPLLIQLYFIFYGLPHFGIRLEPFTAAVLGLGLNYAAYEAENYRAGIQSIARGQYEAAYALGMNQWQTLRTIIIPQSLRLVIPPVTNDFISLLKDSSLVSVITMVELTKVYGQLATTYYDYFGLGILVGAFYLALGYPFVKLAHFFERKWVKEKMGGGVSSY